MSVEYLIIRCTFSYSWGLSFSGEGGLREMKLSNLKFFGASEAKLSERYPPEMCVNVYKVNDDTCGLPMLLIT